MIFLISKSVLIFCIFFSLLRIEYNFGVFYFGWISRSL
jgi:hypothetical protein